MGHKMTLTCDQVLERLRYTTRKKVRGSKCCWGRQDRALSTVMRRGRERQGVHLDTYPPAHSFSKHWLRRVLHCGNCSITQTIRVYAEKLRWLVMSSGLCATVCEEHSGGGQMQSLATVFP